MFERFTSEARQVVTSAQAEAAALGHGWIGTEHLLIGILDQPGSVPARLLALRGVDRARVISWITAAFCEGSEGLDADALATLGIDLAAVRERVEASFGPGALSGRRGRRARVGRPCFTARTKKVLELSLREALALHCSAIEASHIMLGLLREGQGLACRVLADAGVDMKSLAAELRADLRRPAAG